jgi:hypothetical protein
MGPRSTIARLGNGLPCAEWTILDESHMPLTRDAVLHLMTARTKPICPSCVSAALDVEFQRVYDAMQDRDVRGDHRIRVGACGDCGKRQRVILPA